MAIFVADASAALAWTFEDEANTWTDELQERLRLGDRIVVPAHWPTEILTGLVVASRRKRIKPDQPTLFWEELSRLPIETEPALTAIQAKTS
jgi:predicted nucleic acid-binding protein